jgi:hypothetical protein
MRLPMESLPYTSETASLLGRLMRGTGREPLLLFRLFATHPKLWGQVLQISQFQLGRDSERRSARSSK